MRSFFLVLLLAIPVLAQTPAAIEKEWLGRLEMIAKHGSYSGDSNYELLEKENRALHDSIVKYGSRADVLAYSFSKLKDKMFVTTSKDGKFRAYSWDAETGGTMHDFLTVYQFRGRSGKVHTFSENYKGDDSAESAGAFVHQIFQTNAARGPIYLAVSTFMATTSLNGQSIEAFTVTGERLNQDVKVFRTKEGLTDSIGFEYDFFTVVDRPERPVTLFSYNELRKEFKFPVVIEDAKTPQGRVTDKFITYRFDGKYFVKVGK